MNKVGSPTAGGVYRQSGAPNCLIFREISPSWPRRWNLYAFRPSKMVTALTIVAIDASE